MTYQYMELKLEKLEKRIEALEQQQNKDVVSRKCNNCAYYVNGANDEACDGCFEDEYEHPNFKAKEKIGWIPVSKELPKIAGCYTVTRKIGSDLITDACFF